LAIAADECTVDDDCADEVFCNGAEICDPGHEAADEETGCRAGETELDDGIDCTVDECNEEEDEYIHTPDDESCLDGLFCNGAESCDVEEGCLEGTPPDIDDGLGCTADRCREEADREDNEGVIRHNPTDELCLDGLFCNGVETCDPGDEGADSDGCVPGDPADIDDGIPCTSDSCSEGASVLDNVGLIGHTRNHAHCDDGLFCNGTERCSPNDDSADDAGCIGAVPDISDGLACTVDECHEGDQEITHDPDDETCDDEDPCTVGRCDPDEGCLFDIIGCTIDEACHGQGGLNPENACEVCDTGRNVAGWSNLPLSAQCAEATCDGGGNAVGVGRCDGESLCLVPDATDCGGDGCDRGECLEFCRSDDDCPALFWCDLENGECSSDNRPPTAAVSDDQMVSEFDLVTLDGRGSSDPDADDLTYEWTQTDGTDVSLDLRESGAPEFIAPRVQQEDVDLVFELVVDDGELSSEPVETTITVSNATGNSPPEATIQGDDEVEVGTRVILDGSRSVDPDGDAITFEWSQEEGPGLDLDDVDGDHLAVAVEDLEAGTVLSFGLIVNDGLANSPLAVHEITVIEATVERPEGEPDAGVDDGAEPDAGEGAPASDSGCCAVAGSGHWNEPLLLFGLIGLVVLRRRNR
jgi:chitodextrinase